MLIVNIIISVSASVACVNTVNKYIYYYLNVVFLLQSILHCLSHLSYIPKLLNQATAFIPTIPMNCGATPQGP